MNRFDVDTAKEQTSLQEAAQKCGVHLDAHGSGENIRIDCPFGCDGDHRGKREVSISTEGDKLFRCHAYSCGFRGNLLMLMHGWLTAAMPQGGALKGDDFKRVRDVLLGEGRPPAPAQKQQSPDMPQQTEQNQTRKENDAPKRNIPLAASDNEKVRELVGLEELFVTDPAAMNPKASSYFRHRRNFLTEELCNEWGVGLRPTKNTDDKRGWSLRGHVCYRFLSEDNQVLCYVGRDPAYEEKLEAFEALLPEKREGKQAPIKHKFPRGFHRGLELYGQHSDRLQQHPEYHDFIAEHGVIVVEGFNDVLALDALGIPAVAICSNRITEEQVAKVVRWARKLGGSKVSLLFDCEATGDEGAKEALWMFAQGAPGVHVRLLWSQAMHGGAFAGRQPESLAADEVRDVLSSASKK